MQHTLENVKCEEGKVRVWFTHVRKAEFTTELVLPSYYLFSSLAMFQIQKPTTLFLKSRSLIFLFLDYCGVLRFPFFLFNSYCVNVP